MVRPLIKWLSAAGFGVLSTQTFASGFQLWEQDAASIGNYHAGYAAAATDASTAFYNPAGITRFKNQQIVFSNAAVMPSVKYRGSVFVRYVDDALPTIGPTTTTTQGGAFVFVPALHYVTPLNNYLGFGFSIDVPFGSKLSYGRSTALRYIVTQASTTVIDVSPSLAVKIGDKASVGVGPDIQFMSAEFDQIGTFIDETLDSEGINTANDTGYGFHAGGLYEFSQNTRVGISYHSQVVHHLTGRSSFTGPLPLILTEPNLISRRSKLNMTLPPYTALSVYHRLLPNLAIMASAIYTQWQTIQNLVLQDVAGVVVDEELNPVPSTNIVVTIPQHFRNTWNLSVGTDYYVTDKATLRAGIGIDQTPTTRTYRNAALPDNNRFVIALGGHYQATKAIGLDLSWMHVFINKTHISPPPQVTGAEVGITNGNVTSGADVIGAQLTWDI